MSIYGNTNSNSSCSSIFDDINGKNCMNLNQKRKLKLNLQSSINEKKLINTESQAQYFKYFVNTNNNNIKKMFENSVGSSNNAGLILKFLGIKNINNKNVFGFILDFSNMFKQFYVTNKNRLGHKLEDGQTRTVDYSLSSGLKYSIVIPLIKKKIKGALTDDKEITNKHGTFTQKRKINELKIDKDLIFWGDESGAKNKLKNINTSNNSNSQYKLYLFIDIEKFFQDVIVKKKILPKIRLSKESLVKELSARRFKSTSDRIIKL